METEKQLNAKILAKTAEIFEKKPELAEFLSEMLITIPNKERPEINNEILKDYYESLNHLFQKSYY